MSRLLHDRFVPLGDQDAWDLATGARVRLRQMPLPDIRPADGRSGGVCIDWGTTPDGGYFEAWESARLAQREPAQRLVEILIEAFDQGADGEPRFVRVRAADDADCAAVARVAAREARRRGYVPLAARLYEKVATTLAEELRHRTLALIDAGGRDGAVLASAATFNPRPHVLVSIEGERDRRRWQERRQIPWFIAREARAVYGTSEVERQLTRANVAFAAADRGRHAQAERGLREAAAALIRRRAWNGAAHVQVLLGRVLLERGMTAEADAVFSDAVDAADRTEDPAFRHSSRVWLARARVDSDRQTLAESLLRATRATISIGECWARAWSDSVLARCLIAQDRVAEALDVLADFTVVPVDRTVDPPVAAEAALVAIDALLRGGRFFQAGQRCSELCGFVEECRDDRARVSAALAALRITTAAGDMPGAATRLADLRERTRTCHQPLAALEGWLLWVELLVHAGRTDNARREHERLVRASRAAPALLRRRIGKALVARVARIAESDAAIRDSAIALVRLGETEADQAALEGIATRLLCDLRAARVQFQVGDARPASLVSAGSGGSVVTGGRAIDAGIVIGPEETGGAWECSVPVRAGDRTIAALACRWPVGRPVPGAGRDVLEIAAAVAAPRVAAALQQRADAACASLVIPELVGASAAMEELRTAIAGAARAPFAVLIEGESGSGKELVARAIHHLSARRDHRFCGLNCAALPDELLESELFGHARGAFTGALVERCGLFEEAHGGTLFLDELPDLSPRAQAKLLRVLQDGEVRRVGESFTRHVDVQIVAATNRSMTEAVAAGQFRRDLLYRLDVIRIRIPPLRERPGDVPLLARHFWKDAAGRAGTRAVLTHGALAALAQYHWPGNIRELQNVVAALAVAAPARGVVRAGLLPAAVTAGTVVTGGRLADARQQFERRFVEIALARAGGSRTRAAAELGLSRQGLLKLLARLGLAH